MIPASNTSLGICKTEATPEWLTPESISYVVLCIKDCEDAQMLADLRHIFPRVVLTEASRYIIKGHQRQNLLRWLDELNGTEDTAVSA
jgi:hypothetical protein